MINDIEGDYNCGMRSIGVKFEIPSGGVFVATVPMLMVEMEDPPPQEGDFLSMSYGTDYWQGRSKDEVARPAMDTKGTKKRPRRR